MAASLRILNRADSVDWWTTTAAECPLEGYGKAWPQHGREASALQSANKGAPCLF